MTKDNLNPAEAAAAALTEYENKPISKRAKATLDRLQKETTALKSRKLHAETKLKEEMALLENLKRLRVEGSLIAVSDVQEAFTSIASRAKAQMKRFISELPPKLEGLDASRMSPLIREYVDEVCRSLADAFDSIQIELPEIDIEPTELGSLISENEQSTNEDEDDY